jgi:general stress protein 26
MSHNVSFADIEEDFIKRAHTMVWCNVATVDTQGRPRSRVLHPIWEGQTGWIATGRHTLKAKHLAQNPHVSLAYIADPLRPIYIDCIATWDDDPGAKQRIWDLFKAAPAPLGYDLAPFFGGVDNPDYGLLKLTTRRIELADLFAPENIKVWRAT